MVVNDIKRNWVSKAKWGFTLPFFGRVLFPAFMFKKRKEELWNKDFMLRSTVIRNAFLQDLITIDQYKDIMENEYNKLK